MLCESVCLLAQSDQSAGCKVNQSAHWLTLISWMLCAWKIELDILYELIAAKSQKMSSLIFSEKKKKI